MRPTQIDTLRTLLAEKEAHLLHLTEILARQDEADSLLVNHLPEVARRATRVRTVERKITEAQALSVRLFTITISAAIILLFLSYLAIRREMKRIEPMVCKGGDG